MDIRYLKIVFKYELRLEDSASFKIYDFANGVRFLLSGLYHTMADSASVF